MHANMDHRLRDSGTVFQVVDLWASSLLFICTQRSRGRDKSRHACSICYSNDAQKGGSIRALYYCASTLNITGQSYKGNMEASSCMPAMIKQTYMHACFRIRIKYILQRRANLLQYAYTFIFCAQLACSLLLCC